MKVLSKTVETNKKQQINCCKLLILSCLNLKLKVVTHPAEEGGFWAEVLAISDCATQGETIEELLTNLNEAVKSCLSVDLEEIEIGENDQVMEIAV